MLHSLCGAAVSVVLSRPLLLSPVQYGNHSIALPVGLQHVYIERRYSHSRLPNVQNKFLTFFFFKCNKNDLEIVLGLNKQAERI